MSPPRVTTGHATVGPAPLRAPDADDRTPDATGSACGFTRIRGRSGGTVHPAAGRTRDLVGGTAGGGDGLGDGRRPAGMGPDAAPGRHGASDALADGRRDRGVVVVGVPGLRRRRGGDGVGAAPAAVVVRCRGG